MTAAEIDPEHRGLFAHRGLEPWLDLADDRRFAARCDRTDALHSASPDRTCSSPISAAASSPRSTPGPTPPDVAGLVMVDPATQLMATVVSAAALANWDAANVATSDQVREGVQLVDACAQIDAAPPMPRIPAVVLSAGQPWRIDLLPPEATRDEMVTFQDWLTSLDRLAADLDAERVIATDSGHAIYLDKPALVVDAIRTIVDDVRLAPTASAG